MLGGANLLIKRPNYDTDLLGRIVVRVYLKEELPVSRAPSIRAEPSSFDTDRLRHHGFCDKIVLFTVDCALQRNVAV